jgi:hypothetical protein
MAKSDQDKPIVPPRGEAARKNGLKEDAQLVAYLRHTYDAIAAEPLPSKLLILLQKLKMPRKSK